MFTRVAHITRSVHTHAHGPYTHIRRDVYLPCRLDYDTHTHTHTRSHSRSNTDIPTHTHNTHMHHTFTSRTLICPLTVIVCVFVCACVLRVPATMAMVSACGEYCELCLLHSSRACLLCRTRKKRNKQYWCVSMTFLFLLVLLLRHSLALLSLSLS